MSGSVDPWVFAAIVGSSDDAIYSVDLTGTITTWNRAAERLYGYTPGEIVGQPRDILLPSERASEADWIRSRIRTGHAIEHFETVRRRKDGTLFDASLTISPIRGPDGSTLGAVTILRDISDRKLVERALARRIAHQGALIELTDRLQRADTEARIFEAVLDAVLSALGCNRASILLFDDAGVMKFVAWRGLSEGYRRAVEGHSPWTRGTLDAEPIWIPDASTANLGEELRSTIEAEGIRALGFIPIVSYGRLVGKFMTYYDAPYDADADEIAVALTIARQLAFALDRHRAERQLRESVAREHARAQELKVIMESVPAAIWIARDPDAKVITGNRAAGEILSLPASSNMSLSADAPERPHHFEVRAHGRVLSPEELPVQRAARGEEISDFEEEVVFSDGSARVLLGNATPLRDPAGNIAGSVAAFMDITERKQAEKQRDLLMAELSHRVKNTLATVLSIERLSFARNPDTEAARESFGSRIQALAQTHSRLAETNWSGVLLDALMSDELAPYRTREGNIRLDGPPVFLNAKCALIFGLAIHELATNAAKHGALSVKEGRVEVLWSLDGNGDLAIRWQESGGPPVAEPSRSGFGRMLLERALENDLRSSVTLDFARDGLECRILMPASAYRAVR